MQHFPILNIFILKGGSSKVAEWQSSKSQTLQPWYFCYTSVMMKRIGIQKSVLLACTLVMIGSISPAAYALDGLSLAQVGFIVTNPSQERPEKFVKIIRMRDLENNRLFFWTEITCQTKQCQRLLDLGEVKFVHRWVNMYGTRLRTQQVRTFSPEELKEHKNAVWSVQEIKYSGRWFVEVSTSDGEVLCLNKSCKFKLGATR